MHSRTVRSRKGHPVEVVRQTQGQSKRDEPLEADLDEVSQVRPVFGTRAEIEAIFREAQRLRA